MMQRYGKEGKKTNKSPIILHFTPLFVSLHTEPLNVRIMTAIAQKIKETPMAPYTSLLRGMTREQKQIVVTFIIESMEEPKAKRQVPAEFKRLRGMVNITEQDMAEDKHLAHIMER